MIDGPFQIFGPGGNLLAEIKYFFCGEKDRYISKICIKCSDVEFVSRSFEERLWYSCYLHMDLEKDPVFKLENGASLARGLYLRSSSDSESLQSLLTVLSCIFGLAVDEIYCVVLDPILWRAVTKEILTSYEYSEQPTQRQMQEMLFQFKGKSGLRDGDSIRYEWRWGQNKCLMIEFNFASSIGWIARIAGDIDDIDQDTKVICNYIEEASALRQTFQLQLQEFYEKYPELRPDPVAGIGYLVTPDRFLKRQSNE